MNKPYITCPVCGHNNHLPRKGHELECTRCMANEESERHQAKKAAARKAFEDRHKERAALVEDDADTLPTFDALMRSVLG